MIDTQWELSYSGMVLTLGSSPLLAPVNQRAIHFMTPPQIGDPDLVLDDQDRPRGDGAVMGQDYRAGRTITFDVGLLGSDHDDVLSLYRDVLRAWRGDAVRSTPASYAALSTSNLGRVRTCYGRPRRATIDHTQPRSNFMRGTIDFKTVDDLFYAPTEALAVTLVPPPSGGFFVPFTTPLTTLEPTSAFGAFVIDGDVRVWPVITFRGPVTNPECEVVNKWKIKLATSLGAGVSVTVDCRPWMRTVTTNAGASLAGTLTRSSRLDRSYLLPGSYSVALNGTDPTGQASMMFAWQDAYVGI